MRKWNPSDRIIKDTGRRVCNNAGCTSTATVCFEQGDAVWMACGACVPDGVEVVRLKDGEGE
jgi:hypothetical protein